MQSTRQSVLDINARWIAYCAYLESEKLRREKVLKEWELREKEEQKQHEINLAWEEYEEGE